MTGVQTCALPILKETFSLLLVGKLGNFIFEHALTDVSIIVGKKQRSDTTPLILWTKNEKGVVTEALRNLRKINYHQLPYIKQNTTHSIYIPDRYPDVDNWKVNSYQEQELKKHLQKLTAIGKLKTIQDIFYVKQGIRTGNNQVFIITEEEYLQIPDNERNYFRPSIDNESIHRGKITIKNYVWYPYSSSGVTISTENELQNTVPFFYENHLLPNKEKLISRSRKNINTWWYLSEHRKWLRDNNPKLISTEFGKSGSFAFDEKGDYAIERGNGWIPKKDFANMDYYYFYLSIFNSPFFDKLLSVFSKELLKGFDLGRKYTQDIPIPVITEIFQNSYVFEKLVYFGKQMSEGDFFHFEVIDDYLMNHIYLTQV